MMDDEILRQAENLLQPWAKATAHPEDHRLDVTVDVVDLIAAVRALRQARLAYLAAITGLDHPASGTDGELEVLYHFCRGAAVITLRVSVPYGQARVPSICAVVESAVLFERELSELFGIDIEGIPDSSRLVLADDWPSGVYPLRKSFKGLG